MRFPWGRQTLELDLPEDALVGCSRPASAPALPDPVRALKHALEHPVDYPPLWRALTPDDHVAIVLDERTPHLVRLLVTILEHVQQADVSPSAVTLVCLPPSTGQPWLEDLPDEFADVQIEVHQPGDRKKLSYLATTKGEQRVYLNRTAVDADQLIVLSRRTYDLRSGYGGAECTIYPALADQESQDVTLGGCSFEAPGDEPWPLRSEALEVSWLLGSPFLVQVIEGTKDTVASIVCGPLDSSKHGQKMLDARWRVEVEQTPDVVLASITAPDATFEDLARAFANAARVVKPGGVVVLLTEANPALPPSTALLRRLEDAADSLKHLLRDQPDDMAAGYLWCQAALQARLFMLSGLDDEVVEELFCTPLQQAEQVQKLMQGQKCLLLPDADKTLAVMRE